MNVDYSKLKQAIISSLSVELGKQPTFDLDLLEVKVDNAILEVIGIRGYAESGFTDEQITVDLEKYYSVIRNVALYDYATIGAYWQNSHSENGVSRGYTSREKLFAGVIKVSSIF